MDLDAPELAPAVAGRRDARNAIERDRWVPTPGNSASEIRRAFAVFAQSAVRASGGAAQLGGFSN